MRKILLDTNAYSGYRQGNKAIFEALAESDRVYISVIVLAELYYGFRQGDKGKKNREELKSFIKKTTVRLLQVTEETSDIFSQIKVQLKQKGRPIPINDIWIASHCLETGSVLISSDKHFKEIGGLRLLDV